MSTKPICVSESFIQQAVEEFRTKLRLMRASDGTITYSRKLEYPKDDSRFVRVRFMPEAYFKMKAIVQGFTTEVAWHGTVERVSENSFIITDIMVYPQTVTGTTVNTDQERYQDWLMDLDDDTINTLRFQGHSHVHMNVTPSVDDLEHQSKIISNFGTKKDHFYIFMIVNKRDDFNVKVYDMASNTLFEGDSVEVSIVGVDEDMASFVTECKKMVEEVKPIYSTSAYNGSYHGSYGGSAAYVGRGSYNKEETAKAFEKRAGKKKKAPVDEADDSSESNDDFDDQYGRGSIWQDIQS